MSGRGIRSGVAEGTPERVMRAWAGGWPSSLWPALLAGKVKECWAWVHLYVHIHIQYVCTKKCMGTMGTRGQAWWLLATKGMSLYLLSFLPTSPLPLATSSTASWHGLLEEGEKGRIFYITCLLPVVLVSAVSEPAECQHMQVSSWTVIPSCTSFASECLYQMPAGLLQCFIATCLLGVYNPGCH